MVLERISKDAPCCLSSPADGSGPSSMHTIEIEGRTALFVKGMPEEFITACGGAMPGMKVFMYGWIDGERGVSSHVSFPAADCGKRVGTPAKEEAVAGPKIRSVDSKNAGTFRLSIGVRDGDPRYLKLQACVRLKDPVSHNIRTFNLAVSCADLVRMMEGQEECFSMTDQFVAGNAVDVAMRVVNAEQFRNHVSCAGDMHKPLVKFGPSALDRMEEWNEVVERISNGMLKSMSENQVTMGPGCESFKMGVTR